MRAAALLASLHNASGAMDAHTRVLVYSLAFGPFFLLLLVTFLQARRTRRAEDSSKRD